MSGNRSSFSAEKRPAPAVRIALLCAMAFAMLAWAAPGHAQARAEAKPVLAVLAPLVENIPPEEALAFHKGIRMGMNQDTSYFVMPLEAMRERLAKKSRPLPKGCFTDNCLEEAGKLLGVDLVLGSKVERQEADYVMSLVLFDVRERGKIKAVRRVTEADRDAVVNISRLATVALARQKPGEVVPEINAETEPGHPLVYAVTSGALLLTGVAIAYFQGQLLQEDENGLALSEPVLGYPRRNISHLRGFFGSPRLAPRYEGLGGAGVASVQGGDALAMNPAGLARTQGQWAHLAHRRLPGDVPSVRAAYTGSLWRFVYQGVGLLHEGDGLASETTLEYAVATDLARFSPFLQSLRSGATLKGYLLQVGQEGTGQDRSTGHAAGFGVDVGFQGPLSPRIEAGLVLRDVYSLLWNRNTLTDMTYAETLPMELTLGGRYHATRSLWFYLDGQKGLLRDQVDHVRMGIEKSFLEVLFLRGGFRQVYGSKVLRSLTLGVGLEGEAQGKSLKANFGGSFGFEEASALENRQQFSLELGF